MDSFVIDPLRRVAVGYDRYYDADQANDRGDGGVDMGHVRVSHLITRLHYSHLAQLLQEPMSSLCGYDDEIRVDMHW